MSDLIVLLSLIWGAVMTGLVFYYRDKANAREHMAGALMFAVRLIAEGKANAVLDTEGNARIVEVENGL